jgi:hypothetical protein
MSSGKPKRMAEKVIRVRPVAKEFLKKYIAKVNLDRDKHLTEWEAIEEIFEKCDPDVWAMAVRSVNNGNGGGKKK